MSLDTTRRIYIYIFGYIFSFKLRLYELLLLLLLLGQRSIPYGYETTLFLFVQKKKIYPTHNQGYREIIWRER